MSILFFSTDPRPMPIAEGIAAHIRPLSTPQLLQAENLWAEGTFQGLLNAAKYAIPLAIERIDGLKDEQGREVPVPEGGYTPAWVERLNSEAISAFMNAIIKASYPTDDVKND